MRDMAVDPSVGEQSQNVDRFPRLFGRQHGLPIGLVCEKGPILNGPADFGQILKYHPAGADIGMAHLGVAHLAIRKPHIQSGGRQPAPGTFLKDTAQNRLFGVGNGVSGAFFPQAKAIHDN